MTQRDWIEKDFYRELGVASGATQDEIKKAYRKLARELHPDANPGDAKAEARFKSVSEAYGVLSDEKKRKEYDETRALFAGGGGGVRRRGLPRRLRHRRIRRAAVRPERPAPQRRGRRRRRAARAGSATSSAACSAAAAVAGRRPAPVRAQPSGRRRRVRAHDRLRRRRPRRRGADPAVGARPLRDLRRLGARPGTAPHVCPTCAGSGFGRRSQGAFAFSEPCRDCRGTGRIIDDPCPECGGDGVSTRTRSLTVRVPAGVADGNKVRLKGQGQPGMGGAPAGDLYVTVHVTPHRLFGRSEKNADDLTLTVPVTFPELALGSTLTVPTLDGGTVSLRIPAGTRSGRTFRVRGRGVAKQGDDGRPARHGRGGGARTPLRRRAERPAVLRRGHEG